MNIDPLHCTAALWSQAAYNLYGICRYECHGYQHRQTYQSRLGMSVSVGWNQDTDKYIVAYRGSDDWVDWILNLWPADDGRGWRDSWSFAFHESEDIGTGDCINLYLKNKLQGKDVLITGHSLGGVYASHLGKYTGFPVVTFGCPKYSRIIDSGKYNINYVGRFDPVAYVPIRGYHRHGQDIRLPIMGHLMKRYINVLSKQK